MRIEYQAWADFKTDIVSKGFPMNYQTLRESDGITLHGYLVFVVDRTIEWVITIYLPADISDFETNYKTTANRNTTYDTEGKSIDAPKYSESQVFTDVAIRNTSPTTSTVSEGVGYRTKTIIINNQLNQTVTIQCQASRDSTNWFDVGAAWTVSATTLTYQSIDAYFPYMRMIATAASSPTTGTLSAWFEKMGV